MAIYAGPYTATWGSTNLQIGRTLQGFELSYAYRARPITSDIVGQTVIDQIYAGMNMVIDCVLQDYDAAGFTDLTWWFHELRGVTPNAGKSLFSYAQGLVLTACDSTNTPQTITFYRTLLAPDFDVRILYSSRERFIPMRWIVFPVKTVVTGSSGSYTQTATTSMQPADCNHQGWFVET